MFVYLSSRGMANTCVKVQKINYCVYEKIINYFFTLLRSSLPYLLHSKLTCKYPKHVQKLEVKNLP